MSKHKVTFKNVILLGLLLGLIENAHGQFPRQERSRLQTRNLKIGFRVAPSVSANRVDGQNAYLGFANEGSGLRMNIGPTADYFFAEKYAFSTGLWYAVKRAAFRSPKTYLAGVQPASSATLSEFNLQYLQVPLTVKLYTNPLTENLRGYVQFGMLGEIKIKEKVLNRNSNAIAIFSAAENKKRFFGFGDASLIVSFGGENRLRGSDAIVFGVSYQRGLVNSFRGSDLTSHNDSFLLEAGYKF